MTEDTKAIARSAFERIAGAFPRLRTPIRDDDPNVDLAMDIPRQDGLSFDIWLNLQDDELYLTMATFNLSWFPCTKPDYVDAYVDAVCGLISNKYRILEYCRWKWVAESHLQIPDGDGWKTIGRSSRAPLLKLIPFGKRTHVVQNTTATKSGG